MGLRGGQPEKLRVIFRDRHRPVKRRQSRDFVTEEGAMLELLHLLHPERQWTAIIISKPERLWPPSNKSWDGQCYTI